MNNYRTTTIDGTQTISRPNTQKEWEERYMLKTVDELETIEWHFRMETRIMNWNAYRAVSFIIREKERVNEITILS